MVAAGADLAVARVRVRYRFSLFNEVLIAIWANQAFLLNLSSLTACTLLRNVYLNIFLYLFFIPVSINAAYFVQMRQITSNGLPGLGYIQVKMVPLAYADLILFYYYFKKQIKISFT